MYIYIYIHKGSGGVRGPEAEDGRIQDGHGVDGLRGRDEDRRKIRSMI